MKLYVSLLVLFLMSALCAKGQGQITSSHGWTATIEITPVNVVTQSANCPWYYHYEIQFDYNVTFTGATNNRFFAANIYFNCTGGSGGEPYVYFGNFNSNRIGTLTTVNSARQYNATGGAYNYGNKPNCQNIDLDDANCQLVRLEYYGNGVPNGSITLFTGGGPLPIELFDFSADVQDYGVVLNWTTLTEINNDYFLIEKSSNAEDWQVLNTVTGAGTTATISDYSLIDAEHEGTAYYRLTQVDFDGQRKVYEPIVVSGKGGVKVEVPYPNPVDDKLYIPGLTTSDQLMVVNQYGDASDENLYLRNGETIGVNNLPNGIYVFNVRGHDSHYSFKVFVQH